jgi:ubiquinone/menaquinone biosynthesis C-methylase UbiE
MREPVRNYVKRIISKFEFEEPILDCGAGWEPNLYEPLFPNRKYIKQDLQDYDPPCIDVICDICDMSPIQDNSIGLVLLLESLEHIEHPQKALDEVFRVLKPNGLLILTTVMALAIHRYPKDYWRFCPDGMELLMNRFKILDFTLEGEPIFPLGIWLTGQKVIGYQEEEKFPEPNLVKAPRDDRYRILNKLLRRFRLELRYIHKSRPRYD